MKKSDIGLIGLAVMGENLALNMESKGYKVSVYNRSTEVTYNFLEGRAKGKNIEGHNTLEGLVESLESPRKVMIMVKAGEAVAQVVESLFPFLAPGDVIIDGGNSNFIDTTLRVASMELRGIYYVGAGVSGGEEGALKGPAIMPGGSEKAWPLIKPIFQSIAAKAEDGTPCCEWIGGGGSGHFVKMVHNGIEYADMQLISEAYSVMKRMMKLGNEDISVIFSEWNKGKLNSYLVEITSQIMKYKDEKGEFLIDRILDSAGQKGTGKWVLLSSMDLGIPIDLIAAAVFERFLSTQKDKRVAASKVYSRKLKDSSTGINEIRESLYASKIISYSQGFELMQQASKENGWDLNLASIAKIWRNGCIIRSSFLSHIAEAYIKEPALDNLLLSQYFKKEIHEAIPLWKSIVSKAALAEVSLPAFSSALNYFYSFTTENLPANLIQAQRDYFGAHRFERIDRPRGEYFHENWTKK